MSRMRRSPSARRAHDDVLELLGLGEQALRGDHELLLDAGTVGGAPIWPTPKAWFWLWIAADTSCTVMPSCAMRSGRSQTRIAMSGEPNTEARFAPGMRFSSSSTYRLA